MTPSDDELLFMAAASFVEEANRRAFLECACHGDAEQLRRIEELLEIQGEAEKYFTAPTGLTKAEDDGVLGTRIGPYRLIDRLGSGGCGVVYLAEQSSPVKRKVALKVIRLGMDTENVISRFNLEREALALMDHPNIARVLDAGATGAGRPYFVMELVDGEKITEFCDNNRLNVRERLQLFILVCEAIQHAHQKGVIHRDIKPSNILVREDDGRPMPKVIDFGIAKATVGGEDADATVTRLGQFIGTPAYMSPEQAEGGPDVDTRSDIYSLGALLCELLTDRPPFGLQDFKDRGVDEVRNILRSEEPVAPSLRLREQPEDTKDKIAARRGTDAQSLHSMLTGDLDWIVMRAIEKERHHRYETANGLAADVRRYLMDEPVLARPPSRRYLLTKLIRRNRITFAAASIALFGLLSGLGASTWLFLREREGRHEQARLRVVAERATANEVSLRENAKAADMVSQAAVLVRYHEMEPADRLLDDLPPQRVPQSLESANTFTEVARWNLTQERRKEATERFFILAKVLCSVDTTDTDQISKEFLPAITAVCEWGETGQYDHLRKLVLKRFGATSNLVVAEQIIKAILLKPADKETLKTLTPLAAMIKQSLAGRRAEEDRQMAAWAQFSLALMAFRQGKIEDANDWSHQSLATATGSVPRALQNSMILAMVALKQDRVAEAHTAIAETRKRVDEWAAGPFRLSTADGETWSSWITVKILLDEAEKMLGE